MSLEGIKLKGGDCMKQERYPTPDIGRGFMLLFIAVAHAPVLLIDPAASYFSSIDPFVQFLVVTFVDSRAFVMFSLLFGFGLALMVQRQLDKGIPSKQVKASIKRRSVFLILFGFIHFVFIGGLDILAFYGIAGLIIGWILFKPAKSQLRTIIITGFITFITLSILWLFFGQYYLLTGDMDIPASYIETIIGSMLVFPFVPLSQLLMYPFLVVILIGVWSANKEWITQPEKHRPLLKKIAMIGISVSVLGALPYAIISVNLWEPPVTFISMFALMHIITGTFGGLGYTALIALLSKSIKKAWPKVTQVLSAVGKRSLTFFVYQEALLVILLSQLGLGLGSTIGYTGAFMTAVFVWLTGCLFAVWLEINEKRGPLETLLRRLIYKKHAQ